MAGMKSWLEKIKNRILKKDLNDDWLKSKIQSECRNEIADENEVEIKVLNAIQDDMDLLDLIEPMHDEIKQATCEEQEIQREEAMKVKTRHNENANEEFVLKTKVQREKEMKLCNKNQEKENINIKNQHLKHVPECRSRIR